MGLSRKKLPVLEQFCTVQGEGKNLGKPYVFIRVGGCPLRCSHCDTEYSWVVKKDSIKPTMEVAKWALSECEKRKIRWISITGGEPMLYPGQLIDMMHFWYHSDSKIRVQIETSGRFFDEHVHRLCDLWSMDIKTPCTNECRESDLQFLKHMRSLDQVKCLIDNQDDIDYAKRVRELLDDKVSLVLQPFNVNVENENYDNPLILMQKYRWICEKVIQSDDVWPNMIITPQIHVLAWANTPAT